ncbi:MAG: hypothetical protein WC965_13795, partial [Thiohalomonadaceae bacterium]
SLEQEVHTDRDADQKVGQPKPLRLPADLLSLAQAEGKPGFEQTTQKQQYPIYTHSAHTCLNYPQLAYAASYRQPHNCTARQHTGFDWQYKGGKGSKIFKEGKLHRDSVVAKNVTTAVDGKTYQAYSFFHIQTSHPL